MPERLFEAPFFQLKKRKMPVKRIPLYIRDHKKDFVAFSIAVAFFIVFSIFSILQYYSLGTSAYDLGINAQSLYAFIHEGVFYSPLLGENTLIQQVRKHLNL